jgi:fatty acid desaturase
MTHQEILKKVEWRDLTQLTTFEMLIENNLTIPFALVSWLLAYFGYYWLAFPFSIFFFLTALRQVHNGFHNSLGTNRFLTWLSFYLNSILIVSSAHAIKFSHLKHHQHTLQDNDHEGKAAKMKWWQAILYGPIHIFTIHRVALQEGSQTYKRNVFIEMISILVFVSIVLFLNIQFLIYHIIVMTLCECFIAFFAVWVVHHDTDDDPLFARTQRTGWKNAVTFLMFYHLEHHLFPAVPTIKLPELARRIDEVLPELEKKSTF